MSEIVQTTPNDAGISQPRPLSSWSDRLGMVASIGCAIHCAAMPFVVASLPALGLSFLADESFHQWMAVGCFAIAVAAFVPGFRKHGRILPATVGLVGLTMISGAAFGLSDQCCASCEEAAKVETVALTETSDAACEEACCPHCDTGTKAVSTGTRAGVAEVETVTPITAVETESPSLAGISPEATNAILSTIAPWLTPIGGLILVMAHLLNQRYGCLCGCCEDEPADRSDPEPA